MSLDSTRDERMKQIRQELEAEYDQSLDPREMLKEYPGAMTRRAVLIPLTKLNGQKFMLNAEMIETVDTTPDTVICLVSGRKFLVKETVDQIRESCISYKREICSKLNF